MTRVPATAARLVTLGVVLGVLAGPAPAGAIPPPPPGPPQAVLATVAGVAWSFGGVLATAAGGTASAGPVFPTGGGTVVGRGLIEPTPVGRDGWIAADGSTGIMAGRFGAPLTPVPSGPPTAPGCRGWRADTAQGARPPVTVNARGAVTRAAAFAVAGSRLVVAGTGACPGTPPPSLRPLFVRDLRGGPWRVLRQVAARGELVLAATGHWLAVGAPAGTAHMTASVYDHDGTRLRYRVPGLSPGRLTLDTAGRLLTASASYHPTFPVIDPGLSVYDTYTSSWSSPSHPTPHPLPGTSTIAPTIADGRILTLTSGTLQLIDLLHGRTRTLIGTRPPFRTIYSADLTGPMVVRSQSEAPFPPAGSCYAQVVNGAPTVTTLDLRAPAAFIPAPALPPVVDTTACGPPPP
jgi:hypothetical protein